MLSRSFGGSFLGHDGLSLFLSCFLLHSVSLARGSSVSCQLSSSQLVKVAGRIYPLDPTRPRAPRKARVHVRKLTESGDRVSITKRTTQLQQNPEQVPESVV